jgi:hypothetical protein
MRTASRHDATRLTPGRFRLRCRIVRRRALEGTHETRAFDDEPADPEWLTSWSCSVVEGERMTVATFAFAAFGIVSQAVLVLFFAGRRWRPRAAERYGWVAYAFAALGLPLGIWLVAGGQSWRLFTGPLLLALWAALGCAVDLWLRIEWRTPIRWSVFVPYVGLYFWAQMFLWWPLWDLWRLGWAVYAVLFAANTALNLQGHARAGADQR